MRNRNLDLQPSTQLMDETWGKRGTHDVESKTERVKAEASLSNAVFDSEHDWKTAMDVEGFESIGYLNIPPSG